MQKRFIRTLKTIRKHMTNFGIVFQCRQIITNKKKLNDFTFLCVHKSNNLGCDVSFLNNRKATISLIINLFRVCLPIIQIQQLKH
jgi:hypothetical protein